MDNKDRIRLRGKLYILVGLFAHVLMFSMATVG
jgi:hypothetical protein